VLKYSRRGTVWHLAQNYVSKVLLGIGSRCHGAGTGFTPVQVIDEVHHIPYGGWMGKSHGALGRVGSGFFAYNPPRPGWSRRVSVPEPSILRFKQLFA
jgi:hypothetical protein